MVGPDRPGAHRPLHARSRATGGGGGRVPRHRQGQGGADHRPVQGQGHLPEHATPPAEPVLRAEGRDTRGQGNAYATVTAELGSEGDGHQGAVVTDLTVTGKVAQFGRGVMADVSAKLLAQFVSCLETKVLKGDEPDAAPAARPPAPASRRPRPGPAPRRRRRPPPRPRSSVAGRSERVAPAASPDACRTIDQPRADPGQPDRHGRRLDRQAGRCRSPRCWPCCSSCSAGVRRGPAGVDGATTGLGWPPCSVGSPRGDFEVVVRGDGGEPVVIRNDPLLDDGTPMPTRFWLVDRRLRRPSTGWSRRRGAGRRGRHRPRRAGRRPPALRGRAGRRHRRPTGAVPVPAGGWAEPARA